MATTLPTGSFTDPFNVPSILQGGLTSESALGSGDGLGTANPLLGGPGSNAGGSDPSLGAVGAGGLTATPQGAPGTVGSLINPVWEIASRSLLMLLGGAMVLVGVIALLWQSKTVQVSAKSLASAVA
jgi:hypothetical protein